MAAILEGKEGEQMESWADKYERVFKAVLKEDQTKLETFLKTNGYTQHISKLVLATTAQERLSCVQHLQSIRNHIYHPSSYPAGRQDDVWDLFKMDYLRRMPDDEIEIALELYSELAVFKFPIFKRKMTQNLTFQQLKQLLNKFYSLLD